MSNYNVGDVWWVHFPFDEKDQEKYRPAIVIDDDTIAILAMYITSLLKLFFKILLTPTPDLC